MPTLAEVRDNYPQYSDMNDADLANALHAKFYSDMPADQFAEKIGLKPPDKYQQAAIDEAADLDGKGISRETGFTRRLVHGATLGADNTLVAGAFAPIEAIKRGVGLSEGYDYAKAREDLELADARKNTGWLGAGAELLGGGVAGGGLAKGGITAARLLGSNGGIFGRIAASALDGTALGGFSGAMEGNGLQERAANAGQGALLGGAIGAAAPAALKLLGIATAPIVSNVRAISDPTGYAQRQVARAITDSGRTVPEIASDVASANREGQGVFNVGDAMGNAGQRLLSTVARAPGEGRTAVIDALEGRQATQGRRVSNTLAEGFDAPETAAQTERRLTAARDAAADSNYSAVRSDAAPVDVSGVLDHIDQTLSPGVHGFAGSSNIGHDTAEGALASLRDRLTDGRSMLSDFTAVQRVRGDLSDTIEAAKRAGQGNKARLLGGALRELDASMEAASPGHRAANANFAQASRDIDAVAQGRNAAMRGRTEDTIPAYQALTPEGQQAFRSGYVDPLISDAQGAAFGVNRARPLTNDAFRDEAGVMAPGNELMQRRLGREGTMFETRRQAYGGSGTAENLADSEAVGIDPSLVGHLLAHNYGAAAKHLIQAGSNAWSGNTPAVRAEIAKILLQRGAAATPAALEEMVGKTVSQIQLLRNLTRNAGRAGAGAVAVAPNALRKNVGRK